MIRWSGEEVILSSTLSATITRQVERKISKEAKLSLIPPIKIFTQISVPTKVEMSMESRTSSNMFLSIIRRRCISVTLEASQSSKILTIVLLPEIRKIPIKIRQTILKFKDFNQK